MSYSKGDTTDERSLLDELLGSLWTHETFPDLTSEVLNATAPDDFQTKRPKMEKQEQIQGAITPLMADPIVFLQPTQPASHQHMQPMYLQDKGASYAATATVPSSASTTTASRKRDQPFANPTNVVERQLEALKAEAEMIKTFFRERHPSFERVPEDPSLLIDSRALPTKGLSVTNPSSLLQLYAQGE